MALLFNAIVQYVIVYEVTNGISYSFLGETWGEIGYCPLTFNENNCFRFRLRFRHSFAVL